ncbi:MAG TPA: hypothetical protein VN697_03340 [Tepidiformaceae bacterium]|nr:hypothetical protein [Tepidiformaceae bacterium]
MSTPGETEREFVDRIYQRLDLTERDAELLIGELATREAALRARIAEMEKQLADVARMACPGRGYTMQDIRDRALGTPTETTP